MRRLICTIVLIAAATATGKLFSHTEISDSTMSLDGTWRCIAVEGKLILPPDSFVNKFRVKIVGTRSMASIGPPITNFARIKTDVTKKPAEIDIVLDDGSQVQRGLFVLKNDELTILVADPGLPRPKGMSDFKSSMMMKLKRSK